MRYQKLLLIGIILLASILRLYLLGSAPVSLFGDEVDAGYNAFSLLKTGKDYNGNPWPIYSESLGDFRPTAYMYTLIPGIVLFGLNNFSVRIIPALLGIINIYLIYLLIKQAISLVKKNQLPFIIRFNFPLLTALLLTITPWHIHFSRVAIEQTLYLTLLLLGTYAILKTLHHPNWGIIAGCFFALATYTYHAAKLFSPLLFFTLILVYRQPLFKLPKKQLLLGGLTFVLILVPLISDFFYGSGQNRFNSLTWYNHPKLIEEINYSRGQITHLVSPLPRLFQNKLITYAQYWSKNYLMAFSLEYLFISGDAQQPRHSLPGFGLFYWWMLPFFLSGIYICWQNKSLRFIKLILFWLVLAPLPSSLTIDGGQHAIRHFSMVVPIIIIISMGFLYIYHLIKNSVYLKLFLYLMVILASVNLLIYAQRYLYHYSQTNYQQWQYGLIPAINKALATENKYDQIIITRSFVHLPMLYYLFASQYDPNLLHLQFTASLSNSATTPPPTEQINKYHFKTINADDSYYPQNSLYIASPWDRPKNWYLVDQIASPDPMNDQPLLLLLQTDSVKLQR